MLGELIGVSPLWNAEFAKDLFERGFFALQIQAFDRCEEVPLAGLAIKEGVKTVF